MAERGGPNQRLFVKTVVDSLRNDPQLKALAHRADTLEQRLGALDHALADREELYVPENQRRNKLEIALDNTRRVYHAAYHRLKILFPDDPTLVESYFPNFTGHRTASPSKNPTPTPQTTTPQTTTPRPG